MPKSTAPSPPGLASIQVVRESLELHSRRLLWGYAIGAQLCTADLAVLATELLRLAERLQKEVV